MNPEPHGQYMPPPQSPYSGMPSYPPNTPARGIPEWARGLISAALLLPVVPLYYLYDLPRTVDVGPWFGWWVTVAVSVYFVIVVCSVGRSTGRRLGAGAVAFTTACVSAVPTLMALERILPRDDLGTWLLRLATPVELFGFIVAWGISRRRHPAWLVGLVPTIGVAVLLGVLYENLESVYHYSAWLTYLAIDAGLLVLGCLICWGAEAIGRAIGSPRVGPPRGVSYGGPGPFGPQPGLNPYAPQPGPNPFGQQPGAPNPFAAQAGPPNPVAPQPGPPNPFAPQNGPNQP